MDSSAELATWVGPLARYLYVADLISDRVIVDLGCGTGPGCEFVANHGAKQVYGIDTDESAIALARSRRALVNVSYRVGDYAALELEDESVDLVFAHGADLLRREEVAAELRRILKHSGTLIWSAISADRTHSHGGASFYEFADRLSERFGAPRMVAIQPFVGVSLVEYAEGDPVVELDTSLARLGEGPGEVSEYLAIYDDRASVGPRPYTIVQLPTEVGLDAALASLGRAVGDARRLGQELTAERRARQVAERSLSALQAELASLRAVAEAAPTVVAPVDEQTVVMREPGPGGAATVVVTAAGDSGEEDTVVLQPTATGGPSVQVAAAFHAHALHVADLELKAEEAADYAAELEEELLTRDEQLRDLRDQLAAEGAMVDTLRDQLGEWRDRAARAEGEALGLKLAAAESSAAEGVLTAPPAPAVTPGFADFTQIEAMLAEQGAIIAELESGLEELAAAAGELEDHASGPSAAAWTAAKQHRLSSLASEVGTRDAEITLLTVGLRSLRERLGSAAAELREAAETSDGALRAAAERVADRLASLAGG